MRSIPAAVILSILLSLALGGSAAAYIVVPLDEVKNPGVPVIQPDEVIDFSQHGDAGDVAISADGRHVVYTQDAQQLDVWAAIVSYWPEALLGGLSVFLFAGLVLTVRRRRRFPFEHGPFCKKCAYPTRGLTGTSCPECGKSLAGRGVRRGLTRPYAFAVALVLLVAGLSAAAVYRETDPPRHGSASRWIDWRSERLADWTQSGQYRRFYDDIRPTTAIRSIELGTTDPPTTVGHVPISTDRGRSLAASTFYLGPRPFSHQSFDSNQSQSMAAVQTMDYHASIDLKRMKLTANGRLDEDVRYIGLLSEDGEHDYRHPYQIGTEPVKRYTLGSTDGETVVYRKENTDTIELELRSGWGARLVNVFDDEDEPVAQIEAYASKTLTIEHGRLGDEPISIVKNDDNLSLNCRFQAGYLTVLSSNAIFLYDTQAGEWVAELDISGVAGFFDQYGVPTAVSMDRSTVIVLNKDGTKAAVYRLPQTPDP
jgi:hypothetical protein